MKFLPASGLLLCLAAAQPAVAETKTFAVQGGTGATAYAGTVAVTTLETNETATRYMGIQWTFGAYVIRGFGVAAKDDPTLLTVSYVVPAGLGVGRYKIQPDGSVSGTLVGEKGYFVQEIWTTLDGPVQRAPAPAPAPAPTGHGDPAPTTGTNDNGHKE